MKNDGNKQVNTEIYGPNPAELQENRIKNSFRNSLFLFLYTTTISVIPFFVRSCMIYRMGDDYAGLNSVLVSIISMLNMTEMGLSGVIVFFLYEPLAAGNKNKIEAYLNVLRKLYYKIGALFLIIGVALIPFLQYIINSDIPTKAHLYLSYLFLLFSTCSTYIFLPEVPVLVNACQRSDLTSIIDILSLLVTYAIQFMAIICLGSFLAYYVSFLAQAIMIVLLRMRLRKTFFRGIRPYGDINHEEKKEIGTRVAALFGHQMNERFITSIDTIVLSAFMGLNIVTIYGNYMFVVSALLMLLSSFIASITSAIGNAIVTETVESNYVRFRAVLWLNGVITIWFFVCMICEYQTFMHIWMGDRLLPFDCVVLFCVYFFFMQIRRAVVVFKNANGMWWQDRYKPYVSLFVNLLLDIMLVKLIGVKGALISSIACVALIEIPWEGRIVFREYFSVKPYNYIKKLLSFLILAFAISLMCSYICNEFINQGGFLEFLLRSVICTVISLLFSIALFWKSDEFRVWKESLKLLFGKS